MVTNNNRDVFGGTYFMESMRNSGYDTSYALAEIIDNSVEAQAKHIEVICVDKLHYGKKTSRQLDMIGIFDDGHGMDEEELWNSLLMGEGTRRNTKKIGKFGMGLPNSSISQCKNVTVYSWKKPRKVFSTHMDLDKPDSNGKIVAPRPTQSKIPDIWKKHSEYIKKSKSGTLVVWSELDKVQWRTANSLIDNSEYLIGRTYRKFISRDKLSIRLVNLQSDTGEAQVRDMLPNDPIYQIAPSNTPEPWNNKKMFRADGDKLEEIEEISGHKIKISYAYARKEARRVKNGIKAGSQPHGKHANKNLGISLIRADRELYMDRRLCQTYDPMERWWGVEVDFPVELDDVFGVTNNKQNAVNFSTMTRKIGAISRNEEDSVEHEEDEDELYELVKKVNARIQRMRQTIKNTNKDPGPSTNGGGEELPWDDGSDGITEHEREALSDKEREKIITDVLTITDPDHAVEKAREIIKKKIKVKWQSAAIGGNDFFEVSLKGGVAIITLSTEHIIYKYLGEILDRIPDNIEADDARERLKNLRVAIIASIIAWARMENLTPNQDDRDNLENVRRGWGVRINRLVESITDNQAL